MQAQSIEFPQPEFPTRPSHTFINLTFFPEQRLLVMEKGNGDPAVRHVGHHEKFEVLAKIEVPDSLLDAAENWMEAKKAEDTLRNEMYKTFRENGRPKVVAAL